MSKNYIYIAKRLAKKANHSVAIYHYLKFDLVEEVNHSVTNSKFPRAATRIAYSRVLTSTILQRHIILIDLPKTKTNRCQSH